MAFLEVKIILSCVFLMYTNVEAYQPHRDPLPLAHIEARHKTVVQYHAKQVIRDWDVNNVHSRLQGGMKFNYGCLTVPKDGAYYVFAQVYFRSGGRVYIQKNQKQVFTMVQHPYNVPEGPHYTGGVLHLKAGDVISLQTATLLKIFMASAHTYFGAFLIE